MMVDLRNAIDDAIDEIDATDDLLQALMMLLVEHAPEHVRGPMTAVLGEALRHLLNARGMADLRDVEG